MKEEEGWVGRKSKRKGGWKRKRAGWEGRGRGGGLGKKEEEEVI